MKEKQLSHNKNQRQQLSPSTVKKNTKIRDTNEDTGTQHKQHFHQQKKFQRNHPLDPRYISFLNQQRNQSLNDSEYSQAQGKEKLINCLKYDIRSSRVRSLSIQHSREKESIKNAHKRQMQSFRKAWRQIFERNRYYEVRKVAEFDRKKEKQIQLARQEVLRRCKSARPSVKLMEIKDLQKIERSFRKQGRYKELKKIRSEKKQKKKEYQKQSELLYKKIVEQEQRKLSTRQTKRYNSFISRIEESKKDTNIQQKRQQMRLKQKYHNIMRNLQHEQKMEMSNLLTTLPI